MSSPAAAPPTPEPTKTPQAEATLVTPATGWMAGVALIPLLFLIAFHVGAGYLSYQKYASIGWAFLNFLFPYIYYPYYAFFLAREPAPSAIPMMGGRKGLMGALKKMMK